MDNDTDWKPRPIHEQVDAIAQEFCLPKEETLQFLDETFANFALPSEAYGWFALPTIDAVAEHLFPDTTDRIEKYRKATELALDKISKKSQEFEGLDCKSTPSKFFLPERTRLAIEAIRIHQHGAIIVLPVKFDGGIHPSADDEFPLGSFFTACLGLTHWERYASTKPAQSDKAKVECIGYGKVSCNKCWFDDARVKWKQATGYIPTFTTTLAR